jgi:hypothetical protein
MLQTPRFAIAIAALSLSACDLGFDCGTRGKTIASGTVQDNTGAMLGTAQAELSDNVGPSFLRLHAGVLGPTNAAGKPLKGHVTRARLVDEAGQLLAEIPTDTTTLFSESVVALNVDLSSRTEYERVRSALLTNRAKVVLETDLPGRAVIETTLTDAHDVEGVIQRCRPV